MEHQEIRLEVDYGLTIRSCRKLTDEGLKRFKLEWWKQFVGPKERPNDASELDTPEM